MPYVSESGNVQIADDITKLRLDSKTREWKEVVGAYDKPLTLTCRADYSFDRDSQNHVQYVFDGEPMKDMFCFKERGYYRVLTQNFVKKDEDGEIEGVCNESWWRFYSKYRDSLTGRKARLVPNFIEQVIYVPAFEDFEQQSPYGDKAFFHFPVWVLEMMKADGIFERFKGITKINNGKVRYVTDDQIEKMMIILDQRKAEAKLADDEEEYLQRFKKIKRDESSKKATAARQKNAQLAQQDKLMRLAQSKAEEKLDDEWAKLEAEKEKLRKEKEELEALRGEDVYNDPKNVIDVSNVTIDEGVDVINSIADLEALANIAGISVEEYVQINNAQARYDQLLEIEKAKEEEKRKLDEAKKNQKGNKGQGNNNSK